jgi:uncharacterized protein YajQ (UPF0234 family)
VDTEVDGDVSDRTLRLQSESNATVHQLIGILLRSWHERGVPLPRTEILVSRSPSNPAWLKTVVPAAVWETLPSASQQAIAVALARLVARLVEAARDE